MWFSLVYLYLQLTISFLEYINPIPIIMIVIITVDVQRVTLYFNDSGKHPVNCVVFERVGNRRYIDTRLVDGNHLQMTSEEDLK